MAAQDKNSTVIASQQLLRASHCEQSETISSNQSLLQDTKQSASLTPKLRFKEFQGEWKLKLLGNTCVVKTGGSDTQDRVEGGKYPFFVRSNTVERIDNYSFDGEAILTSGDGVGVGKNFHYIIGKFDYHQRVYALKEFKDGFSGRFIYQVFAEKFYKRVIRLSAKNSVDSVRMNMITEMKIHFPSLSEQQKIASFLSAVDEKIQQLTKKKELMEEYKKGVMQKLFSGQLRFKDENGNDYPDWEEKSLKDVCLMNPKSKRLPSSFIYIDLESVDNGQLVKENRIELNDAPSRAQRSLLINDILYQMVRPYQKNNLFFTKLGDYVASTGYAQLRPKEDPMFIYQLMHFNKFVNKVLVRCTGTSYPAINSSDLGKIHISMPVIEEQQKIANFLSSIDKKIVYINSQIEQTNWFKKGLLQQLFLAA